MSLLGMEGGAARSCVNDVEKGREAKQVEDGKRSDDGVDADRKKKQAAHLGEELFEKRGSREHEEGRNRVSGHVNGNDGESSIDQGGSFPGKADASKQQVRMYRFLGFGFIDSTKQHR
jgi:hypothetical protein